jgi:hypothetical protein
MLCIFILYISILTHAPPSPPFLTFGARHSHGCGRLYACSPPGGTQCPPFTVLVLVINTHYYYYALFRSTFGIRVTCVGVHLRWWREGIGHRHIENQRPTGADPCEGLWPREISFSGDLPNLQQRVQRGWGSVGYPRAGLGRSGLSGGVQCLGVKFAV